LIPPVVSRPLTLHVVSDIHYAAAAERARGPAHLKLGQTWLQKRFVRFWHDHLWMRDATAHNAQLHRFLAEAPPADWLIANGDYSCNSTGVGVSDDASRASAGECLDRLRARFAPQFRATIGDHELGKLSMVGGLGGLRLASWERVRGELGVEPFWRLELGDYVLLGVTSTVIALPVFEREAPPVERPAWQSLRAGHLRQIRQAFASLGPRQRVLLFCHDPSALPFLWEDEAVRAAADRIERTFIGHLHSRAIWGMARLLSGLPPVAFLGSAVRRYSTALHRARDWRPFRVALCPSLAGVEIFRSGGWLTLTLDPSARDPVRITRHRMPWREAS
jgi:hypothetical protein